VITFIKIYGLIVLFGYISATIDRFILKKKNQNALLVGAIYCALYYYVVVLFRTITGNGHDYLSFSFHGKTLQGYVKVAFLLVAVYVLTVVIESLLKEKYRIILEHTVGWFAVFNTLHIVLINQPSMMRISILGVISLVLALFDIFVLKKNNTLELNLSIEKTKKHCRALGSVLTLYALLFYIVGPSELYAYNSEDFMYSYGDFAPLLIIGGLLIVFFTTVLISNLASEKVFGATTFVIFTYIFASYVQSMFLNGQMNEIDGSVQTWSRQSIIINIIIWSVIIVLCLALYIILKKDKALDIIKTISIILGLVQIVTYIFLMLTTNMVSAKTKQLLEDDVFTLSKNDNVIIFILDAYDIQMMDKVLEKDATYLEPLHDFTFYNNMTSMYGATDGSLPYLLTGIETDRSDNYESTHFLDDIKDNNYDIRILSERKYVDRVREGVISNYSDKGYYELDMEKTLNAFSNTMRYKGMPYLLKDSYKYESYHLTNIITDTNAYIYGTDNKFDDLLLENGVSKDLNANALRIYHLYGAHAPYFLDENGDINYDANDPIAQWKGCLKIVYDYLDALKKAGLYDNSTVIIMADHGLNRSQRSALDSLGMEYDAGNSNPIFFIKRQNQHQNNLIIDEQSTSHEKFFDTIMKCVDSDWNNQYSGAVWE